MIARLRYSYTDVRNSSVCERRGVNIIRGAPAVCVLKAMSYPLYLAKRLSLASGGRHSSPAIRVAVAAVALFCGGDARRHCHCIGIQAGNPRQGNRV